MKRTKNPKLKLFGNASFASIDLKRTKKLDKRTCRIFLTQGDVTLIEAFAQYFQGIVPVGYAPNAIGKGPLKYIGTGPFKVKSFTPGRESVHVKNENYWRTGQPYFDEVRIINFPSDAAKVNALLSGQIEAMSDVPFAQIPVVKGRKNLRIYTGKTGAWTPICMRVDVAPVQRRAGPTGVPSPHQPPAGRAAGPLRLRDRRQRHLLAVRSLVRGGRLPTTEVRPRAGEVAAQGRRVRKDSRSSWRRPRGTPG